MRTNNSFGRVLRLTLRYRWTFLASVACALVVAALWGGNIGALFPVLKIAFQGQSLQQWVAEESAHSRQAIVDYRQQMERAERAAQAAPPAEQAALAAGVRRLEGKRVAEEKALYYYTLAQPYLERFVPHDPFLTLVLMIGLLFVGTAIKDLFLVANSILVARLAELTTFHLRKQFYRRTLRLDVATFSNEGASDLMSRFTNDMNSISAGLVSLFGRMIREPLKGIACLAGAAFISWRLLLFSLLLAPPTLLAVRWLAKTLKRANRRAMEEMAQIYDTLDETFRGIKIVKAFTMERQERWRFHHAGKKYYHRAMKIARYDSLTHPITELGGIVTICLAVLAGAWLVLQGKTELFGIRMTERTLSIESLLIFYGLLAGVADPLRKLSDVLTRIQQASAASERIFAMLDREPTVRDAARPVAPPRHHVDLVFDGVNFAYQAGQPVLHDVNLRIQFGETIAIVGPNGCGKSTLANLIPRFADPTGGEIRLDGAPLPQLRLRQLRRQIGLVAQETLLFDDTVYNNIRYGAPWATRDQVVEAAKQAHAHAFIENQLAEGYDTVVGQFGGRLSGGQRQRITLARAILRDPAIIVLDEATSQVDIESEQLIQRVLERFVEARTAIIITHRLATLALADRIVVMEAGRILDVGTHAELLARCPLFARLYQVQSERLRQTA